jgi:acyl-CoA synthetase (AMP-forming)/AMP-acid ligase II
MLLPAQAVQYSVSRRAADFDENTKYLSGGGIEGTIHYVIGVWCKGGTLISNAGLRGKHAELARAITETTRVKTTSASLVAIMASQGGEFAGRESRIVRVGGAPLPVTLRDDALARFCGRIDIGYGSRETGTMAEGDASLLDRHPSAVGYPARDTEIQIVDRNAREVACGDQGIVRVRTIPMVQSYLNDPEATARVFRDGWFYPGDIGIIEDDGLIVILGRESDVLNVGGVKFSANVVENDLRRIEGIADVCALAVANRLDVKVMVILAVSAPGADQDALESIIGKTLAGMDLRNFLVRWTEEIPYSDRGKIARDRLAEDMREALWG